MEPLETIESLTARAAATDEKLSKLIDLLTPKDATPAVVPVEVIHERSTNATIWMVALAVVLWVGVTEYRRRLAPDEKPTAVEVPAAVEQTFPPDDVWAAIAARIRMGKIEHTSEVLSVAKQMDLDLTRLKPIVDKPARITDSNRQAILDLIGGGK